jgi:hypothetical protein
MSTRCGICRSRREGGYLRLVLNDYPLLSIGCAACGDEASGIG